MSSTISAKYSIELAPGFAFKSDEYSDLVDASDAHVYQQPIWLDAFYRIIAPNRGARPHFLVARRQDDGVLQFVLPLILRRKFGLRLLETADLGVSDYAVPVGLPAFWQDLERDPALRRKLAKALPRFDLLRMRPVREEDCRKFMLVTGTDPIPLGFSSHASVLWKPYDEWRKSALNGSLRKMIDRKMRKLHRDHSASLKELDDPDEIQRALTRLASLRAGRFDKDPIQQEFVLSFYIDVAQQGVSTGLASTWLLEADGKEVGILFGVTLKGRFYYLLIGCDYDNFGQYSPGLLMYDGIMENWTERGGSGFDFTIGDEAFKRKFGTAATTIYMFLSAGSLIGRMAGRVVVWRLNKRRELLEEGQ